MCQHCKRFGTTLVSYPWPSEPVRIEMLPPMSEELSSLIADWNALQAGVVPPRLRAIEAADLSYSSLRASLAGFLANLGMRSVR